MNRVYYFSGTGNSLWTAQSLVSHLPDFELLPVTSMVESNSVAQSQECAAVGFVFPVYLYGPPLIARRFLSSLKVAEGTYTFYVAVHGGYLADTVGVARRLLQNNGGHLDAGFGLKTPGNCIIDYDPPSSKIIEESITAGENRIAEIARMVSNRHRGHFERGNVAINWFLTGLLHKLLIGSLPGYAGKFVVEDTCTSCETCRRVCPVSNVEIKDGKPHWGSNCEMCLACLQSCPAQAIQWGKRTKSRRRYRNPRVSLRDMEGQQMAGKEKG